MQAFGLIVWEKVGTTILLHNKVELSVYTHEGKREQTNLIELNFHNFSTFQVLHGSVLLAQQHVKSVTIYFQTEEFIWLSKSVVN